MKVKNSIKGENINLILREQLEANPQKGYVPKLIYNIVLPDTDITIGECDARIGNNENTYWGGNIGYTVHEEYRGNGYAVEAVKLLLSVFKDNNIKEVYITNDVSNLASRRVCEKVGAKFLGAKDLPLNHEMRKEGKSRVNIFLIKIN